MTNCSSFIDILLWPTQNVLGYIEMPFGEIFWWMLYYWNCPTFKYYNAIFDLWWRIKLYLYFDHILATPNLMRIKHFQFIDINLGGLLRSIFCIICSERRSFSIVNCKWKSSHFNFRSNIKCQVCDHHLWLGPFNSISHICKVQKGKFKFCSWQ